MEELRRQAQGRTLALRPASLRAFLVQKCSLLTLGAGMGWVAARRERIFTTETKTVFHHPHGDERAKGIISQSVAWEVNRG